MQTPSGWATTGAAIYWNVFGSFSKGIKGAMSLNFGQSGGVNCATSCRHHPKHYRPGGVSHGESGECYAIVVERRADRAQLARKLERHETLPASTIVGRAMVELSSMLLRGKSVPWLRISTNGAVPSPESATADSINREIERRLIAGRKPMGTMTFWAEDAGEAKACAKRLRAAGLTVRTQDYGDQVVIEACHDIRVGEIGDLGDLVADYVGSGAIPESGIDAMCREFNFHPSRKLRSFFRRGWDGCPLWLTGLILGYPVENTISIYHDAVS